MKRITILIVGLLLVVVSLFYFLNNVKAKQLIEERTYRGKVLSEEEYQELKEENEKAREAFPETVRKLNKGWDLISAGHKHMRDGNLAEAIQAYKEAYETDPRNGLTSRYLMEAYEKNGQYVEALAIVDERFKTRYMSEYGIEKYTAYKERLTQLIEASNAKK